MRSFVIALAILSVPSSAFAFTTFASYEQDVLEGGGGGRFFTGSVSDGYVCNVCHFGGDAAEGVDLTITPDPFEDGYVSGETYEVVLTLPTNTNRSGATLELVDETGAAAGTIELIPAAMQGADDQCSPDQREDDLTAAFLATTTDPPRQIAGLDVCGAEVLRVIWTAPETATGQVQLHAATVASTADPGFVTGDFAEIIERSIPPFGVAPMSPGTRTGCRASPGHLRPGASGGLAGVLAGLLLAWRRRRPRTN